MTAKQNKGTGTNKKITNRIYLRGTLCLESPAIIASGLDDNTDIDILRDYKGNPNIAGSTLAGLSRSFCADGVEMTKEAEDIGASFGKSDFERKEKEEGQKDKDQNQEKDEARDRVKEKQYTTLSSLIFYDAPCVKNGTVSQRDGVKLNQNKTAEHEGKLDYEVVDCGTEFNFRLEAVIREGQLEAVEKNIARIVYGLEHGLVRIGMKTRRGFGRILLKNIKRLKLDMSEAAALDTWINFSWDQVKEEYTEKSCDRGDKYITITVPLELPYSLLIRSYLTQNDEEEPCTTKENRRTMRVSAEQLTRLSGYGKKPEPIIPGTSWAGAFRAYIEDLCRQSILPGLEIDEIFGRIGKNGNGKSSLASAVCFEESVVIGGKRVKQIRTAIDRFLGGASRGALYAVRPLLNTGGKAGTELTIRVLKKDDENDYIVGLMLLCIDELARGMLSVGGETSIGRGIFTLKGVSLRDIGESPELVPVVVNEKVTITIGKMPGKKAEEYRKKFVEKIKETLERTVNA